MLISPKMVKGDLFLCLPCSKCCPQYCNGSWWERMAVVTSISPWVKSVCPGDALKTTLMAHWAETSCGKTWLPGKINETTSEKCFQAFCQDLDGSINTEFSSESCCHTVCPPPSGWPQLHWAGTLLGRKAVPFPHPVRSPLGQAGCWVWRSLCEVDICLMGPGLWPPVRFTQATIQLPGGDGSELLCKSNMACSILVVGNQGSLHPAHVPAKAVLPRAKVLF